MESFGKFCLTVTLGAIGAVVSAFVLRSLWLWFIVPYFHLAPISLSLAYGFMLFISLCIAAESEEHEDKSFGAIVGRIISGSIIRPLIILMMAWIVR